MNTVSPHSTLRGMNFARAAIALAIGGKGYEAVEYARQRWGVESPAAKYLQKAAVAAGTTQAGAAPLAHPVELEFFNVVAERSIIGNLSGLRRVPFNINTVNQVSGLGASFVGEGKPIPVSLGTYSADSLDTLKIASLVVTTEELAKAGSDPSSEIVIRQDLLRAYLEASDKAFIDPANAGVADVSPASITNGAPSVAATADPTADLKALFAAFSGDLAAAFFIMHPNRAVSLYGSNRPNIGARGGDLALIPVLTSRHVPSGVIALADPGGIALAEGEGEVEASTEASIEMLDSALVQNAATGTGTSLVSLWQTNSVAIKTVRTTNWRRVRAGSVAYISGANY